MVLGLLIDQEGLPIGFDVFPGNTFEGHTLETALSKLKKRFKINKVVIIADRGLNAKLNLNKIKNSGYDYIVGSRIKNLDKKTKEAIFESKGYESIEVDSNKFKYKILNHKFKVKDNVRFKELFDKIVITWSSKRAAKDKKDRQRLIIKAGNLLKTPSVIKSGKGAKRYIKVDFDKNPVLNEEKIKEDAKWDGFYGIQTSSKDLTPQEVIRNYHYLWKIEESFRELKSNFEARPIFHWTPDRIKGHLVLCFIAFLLSRTLELRLRSNEIECSCARIQEALNSLQISEIQIKKKSFYLKSCSNSLSKSILRVMKIKPPANLTSKRSFSI